MDYGSYSKHGEKYTGTRYILEVAQELGAGHIPNWKSSLPPTAASCSYLQVHIYSTDGHLCALSGDGLQVLSQHLLSGQF